MKEVTFTWHVLDIRCEQCGVKLAELSNEAASAFVEAHGEHFGMVVYTCILNDGPYPVDVRFDREKPQTMLDSFSVPSEMTGSVTVEAKLTEHGRKMLAGMLSDDGWPDINNKI